MAGPALHIPGAPPQHKDQRSARKALAKVIPHRDAHARRPKLRELLPIVEIVGGYIAIVYMICDLRGMSPRVSAHYALVALFVLAVVAACALYRERTVLRVIEYLNRVPLLVVWSIALSITMVLIWHIWRPADAWARWNRDLTNALTDCNSRRVEAGSTDRDPVGTCIAQALALVHPSRDAGLPETMGELANDLHIGSIVFAHPELRKRLGEWYGIDERFVGSGISQPLNTSDHAAARIPEFLTPNYNTADERIWVWKIDPSDQQAMSSLLVKFVQRQPDNRKDAFVQCEANEAAAQCDAKVRARAANPSPVVRFALIPEAEHSTCLGLRQRHRVFTSSMRALLYRNIRDAAEYSGYSFNPFKEHKVLYLMLFVPSHDDEVVPATWTKILANSGKWVLAPDACKQM